MSGSRSQAKKSEILQTAQPQTQARALTTPNLKIERRSDSCQRSVSSKQARRIEFELRVPTSIHADADKMGHQPVVFPTS